MNLRLEITILGKLKLSEVWVDSLAHVCSRGSIVVTILDCGLGGPWLESRWVSVFYEARSTAQGLPKLSSLRGSTLGTRAAEHKGCHCACKLTDGCSLKSCVRPHLQWHHLAYATEIKVNSPACSAYVTGLRGTQFMCCTFTFNYIQFIANNVLLWSP